MSSSPEYFITHCCFIRINPPCCSWRINKVFRENPFGNIFWSFQDGFSKSFIRSGLSTLHVKHWNFSSNLFNTSQPGQYILLSCKYSHFTSCVLLNPIWVWFRSVISRSHFTIPRTTHHQLIWLVRRTLIQSCLIVDISYHVLHQRYLTLNWTKLRKLLNQWDEIFSCCN